MSQQQIVVNPVTKTIRHEVLETVEYRSWRTLWRWRTRSEWRQVGVFFDPKMTTSIAYRLNGANTLSLSVAADNPLSGLALAGDTGSFTDDYGTVVTGVHPPSACADHCVIHNPSDHGLRHMKLAWRQAGPFDIKPSHFERICEHGVGHPDPDSIAYLASIGEKCMGVHGCDGCCRAKDSE